jgi:hypothetical protein
MKVLLLFLVLLAGALATPLINPQINNKQLDLVDDNSTTCNICTELVGALESAVGDNSSQPFLLIVLAQA